MICSTRGCTQIRGLGSPSARTLKARLLPPPRKPSGFVWVDLFRVLAERMDAVDVMLLRHLP